MRKKVVMILVFLFVATLTGYSGGDNNDPVKNGGGTSGQYGSLYGNRDSNTAETTGGQSGGGLFRSPEDDFGERPGGGGGIGQEAPLGDGLPVLVACCLGLVVVKTFNAKKENNFN